MVKDIHPTNHSSPDELVVVGDTLYFTANDPDYGVTLYKTQGTAATTTRIRDLIPNGADQISELTAFGNKVYFRAYTPDFGHELWVSDGTEAGTKRLSDIATGGATSDVKQLTVAGGILFFSARNSSNDEELWKLDGESVVQVKNINTGTSSRPQYLTAVGDTLFFSATGPDGQELYKSNGESSGTVLVKDIYTNGGIQPQGVQAQSAVNSSYPQNLYALNDTLYFIARTAADGKELWKSDGTEAGTVMVKSINSASGSSFPADLFRVGNKLMFTAHDGMARDLWISDGTEAGTQKVMNTTMDGSDSKVVSLAANQYLDMDTLAVGDSVLLGVRGELGDELWKTDGTAEGTIIVRDINEGVDSSLIIR